MSDFEVRGADDFLRLSKALKAAGRAELRKELHKALRAAVKAHTPKAESALAEHLPYLRGRQKAVTQAVQVKTGRDPGVTVGVRFGSKRSSNARLANREGRFRHPVFGNRSTWVDQPVPGAKGWFDRVWEESAPEVRDQLEKAIQDVAEKVVREAK